VRFSMRRPVTAPLAAAGFGAAGLAVAALISGCVAVAAADEDGRRGAASPSASPASSAGADDTGRSPAGRVTAGQAEAIALKAVPGTVTDMELDDDDDGRPRWEVDVRPRSGAAREVHVDAITGEVLATTDDGGADGCDGSDDDGSDDGGKDDGGKRDDGGGKDDDGGHGDDDSGGDDDGDD
jgi:hypothetical protein